MKPDHISQRMQRQCGVPRHLVDRLPIEREDHSVTWQASLPQHSPLPPARDRCVRHSAPHSLSRTILQRHKIIRNGVDG